MGKLQIKKGTVFHHDFDTVSTLEIVLAGNVRIKDLHHSITASSGAILGVLEDPDSTYNFTYEALDDVTLFSYSYSSVSDIERVVTSNPKIISNLASAAIKMYNDAFMSYQKSINAAESIYKFVIEQNTGYLDLCAKFKVPPKSLGTLDEISAFTPDEPVPVWEAQFFNAIRGMSPELKKSFYSSSVYIGSGIVMEAIDGTRDLHHIQGQVYDYLSDLSACVISDSSGDYFDLYSNLMAVVSKNPFADTTPIEAAVSKMIIYMTDSTFLDIGVLHDRVSNYRQQLREIEESLMLEEDAAPMEKDAYEALDQSLETILDYAKISPEKRGSFRHLIDSYKLLSDKNSTDDNARYLRRALSEDFYNIYESAFFNSIDDKNIPTAVKMFFYFGYMDEELCSMNNASILYEMVKELPKDPARVVVTLYDWLLMVYNGEAEPSKNEFDMDYVAYVRDLKHSGSISAEQEYDLLNNRKEKVKYEIHNLFSIGNRITFGRISTFCPVLSDHNILRPLKSTLLTPELVYKTFDEIRQVDFSCFYRDTMYTNPAIGIQKEYISKEVLPNVIMMPNIGSRGSLWQETADSRRDSRGRIMISIFPTENVADILTRLAGEFRWELCKKIQGVHWNDVTDPSLTSEYCDYIQFYRKNHELSTDAKEKIKTALQKAKNNYREVFVMDYVQWIKYEGHGSPRLNKYARGILARYCPFTKAIRDSISVNPLYSEFLEKYNIKLSQKKHLLEVLEQKLSNGGHDLPPELVAQKDFLNM